MAATPVDIAAVLEEVMDAISPGTVVIVKLFDTPDEEAEEESLEPDDIASVYDMFTEANGSPSTGGGTTADAILMDNPSQ